MSSRPPWVTQQGPVSKYSNNASELTGRASGRCLRPGLRGLPSPVLSEDSCECAKGALGVSYSGAARGAHCEEQWIHSALLAQDFNSREGSAVRSLPPNGYGRLQSATRTDRLSKLQKLAPKNRLWSFQQAQLLSCHPEITMSSTPSAQDEGRHDKEMRTHRQGTPGRGGVNAWQCGLPGETLQEAQGAGLAFV